MKLCLCDITFQAMILHVLISRLCHHSSRNFKIQNAYEYIGVNEHFKKGSFDSEGALSTSVNALPCPAIVRYAIRVFENTIVFDCTLQVHAY